MRRDFFIKKYKLPRSVRKDTWGHSLVKHGSFLRHREQDPEVVWRRVVNSIILDYERRYLFDFRNKYSSISRSRRRRLGRLHPVWSFFRQRRHFFFERVLKSFTVRFGPLFFKYNIGKEFKLPFYLKTALEASKEVFTTRTRKQIRRDRRRGIIRPPVNYSPFFPWVKRKGLVVEFPKHMRLPSRRFMVPFWTDYFVLVRSFAYAWRIRFGFWQRKYRYRLRHLFRRLLFRLHMLGRIYRNLYHPTPAMLKKPPYRNMSKMVYLFSRIDLPSPQETKAQLKLSKTIVRVFRLVTKPKHVKFPLLWRWLRFLDKIEKKPFLKRFGFSFLPARQKTLMVKRAETESPFQKNRFKTYFSRLLKKNHVLKDYNKEVYFHQSVMFSCHFKALFSHSSFLLNINYPINKNKSSFVFLHDSTNYSSLDSKSNIGVSHFARPGFLLLGWEYLKKQVKFGFVRRRLNNQQNFILQLTYDNPRVAVGDYEDGFRIPYIPRDHQKRSKKQARMLEHYRLQVFYGIFDMRLFKKKYFDLFKSCRHISSARLNQLLECRVIFLLQLTNFFSSIYFIDQIIKHRSLVVNDSVVTESHKVLGLGDSLFMPESFYWFGLNTFLFKIANFRLFLNMPTFVEPNYVLGGLAIIGFPLRSQMTLPFGKRRSSYDPSFIVREFVR